MYGGVGMFVFWQEALPSASHVCTMQDVWGGGDVCFWAGSTSYHKSCMYSV